MSPEAHGLLITFKNQVPARSKLSHSFLVTASDRRLLVSKHKENLTGEGDDCLVCCDAFSEPFGIVFCLRGSLVLQKPIQMCFFFNLTFVLIFSHFIHEPNRICVEGLLGC